MNLIAPFQIKRRWSANLMVGQWPKSFTGDNTDDTVWFLWVIKEGLKIVPFKEGNALNGALISLGQLWKFNYGQTIMEILETTMHDC